MASTLLILIRPHRRLLQGITKRRRGGILFVVLALIVLVVAGATIYGQNYDRIEYVIAKAVQIGPDAPFLKMRVVYDVVVTIPREVAIQPLLGLGPGQFSSRAALILTGQYLSRASIPFLGKHTSPLTQQYILPYLGTYTSSNHFPSSSWLTVYSETGIAGMVVMLFLILRGTRRFCLLRSMYFPRINLAALILLFYVMLMGLQTVYWEYTQGIFFAIFTLKLMYDFLGRENVERKVYVAGTLSQPLRQDRPVLASPQPPIHI